MAWSRMKDWAEKDRQEKKTKEKQETALPTPSMSGWLKQ
jgi:hypothetical protein